MKIKEKPKAYSFQLLLNHSPLVYRVNYQEKMRIDLFQWDSEGYSLGGHHDGHRFGPPAQGGHQLTIWVYPTTSKDT